MELHKGRCLGLLALVAWAVMLQGCREDEQNRVLIHEKGVYQGQDDQALDQAQLDQLRQRAQMQQY